jgi:hypothetical protein
MRVQRLRQIFLAIEVMRLGYICNAAIEALVARLTAQSRIALYLARHEQRIAFIVGMRR